MLDNGGFVWGGSAAFAILPLLTPYVLIGAFCFGTGISVIFALYPSLACIETKTR